jgi:hypothetical protein
MVTTEDTKFQRAGQLPQTRMNRQQQGQSAMSDKPVDNRGLPMTALAVISILLSMLWLVAILARVALQNLQMG